VAHHDAGTREANRVAYKWMPIILEDRCTGCGLCVHACGPKSLTMADGIAVLAFPDTCGSEEHCIAACRDGAIQMAWIPFSGNTTLDRWRDEIERDQMVFPDKS